MKVRIKFTKTGHMKFVGHLDTMRYFQKAIRRAGLPVAFSGGYSPHMILSFAAPLGVGTTSLGEYFDMELTEALSTDAIEQRLNAVMVVLSFVFKGQLNGVREGTVIAALLVGFIARVLGKRLAFVKNMLFSEEGGDTSQEENTEIGTTVANGYHKNVIVIGRQFGSGGHDIGKVLAEKLGYAFYDQEIIEMTAGTTGYTPAFIQKKEEMMTNSLLYDLVNQAYIYRADQDQEAPKDKIFEAESRVVRELAEKGNCVIVGRCSDYVLRNNKNCLKIFFSASIENRVRRVVERLHISEKEAKQKIQKEDKWRADNYRYYTGRIWGAAENFDLTVNTALGEDYIETCVKGAMGL